jgi:hypothetical protein
VLRGGQATSSARRRARVVVPMMPCSSGNSPTMSVSRSALASSAPRSASATSPPSRRRSAGQCLHALGALSWVPSLLW